MKNILFFLFLNFSLAQTTKVEYELTIDMSATSSVPFKHKIELINSQGKSLAKKYRISNLSANALNKNNEPQRIITRGSDTIYTYKEFDKNKLFSEEKIFTKIFNVKDSLHLFEWNIENDTISILGYKCYKAKTKFRGREFEVFFTNEITLPDGPAKYNGLPGLILKVSIVNSSSIYSIIATKITKSDKNTEIINPFDEKECLDFTDFKKKFIAKMNELESYNANQDITIGRTGLEILIDE